MKKNNEMTVDKLAEITQKGFEEMRGEIKDEVGGLRDEMNEKFNRVFIGQDQILKRLEDLEADNTMDTVIYRQHEDKLKNHEKRIIVVENKILA